MLNVNTLLMPIFIQKLQGLHQTIVQTLLIWFYYTETCYPLFCDQTRCMSGQTLSLAWCMTGFIWEGNFSSYNVFQLVTLKNISELSKQEIWLVFKKGVTIAPVLTCCELNEKSNTSQQQSEEKKNHRMHSEIFSPIGAKVEF